MSEPSDDLGFELPAPAQASRGRVVAIAVLIVGGAVAFRYVQHRGSPETAAAPVAQGNPRVEVIKPKAVDSGVAPDLTGTVMPLEEAKIYPRVTGYIRRWLVDIGDKVAEGQLLAEIDTPEVSDQLAQAQAQLAQAKAAVKQALAQRDYSHQSSTRYQTLADQQLVAKAQLEQTQAQAATDEAGLAAAQSSVAAQEANVQRLAHLQSYAKVAAPFAGTITARFVDRGAAVVGDLGSTPLFTLSATDPVRVFVNVPQPFVPNMSAGLDVTVTAREYNGRTFAGKVTRSAGALDPNYRVMPTEIRIPNPDGALLPGMYVLARITRPVPHTVLEIPATALYGDAQGLRVAVVDAQHKIHFAAITIERDTGSTLQIATGLTGDEQIVKIAVPTLVEGDAVDVAK